jgi:site-specific DNA recombinase
VAVIPLNLFEQNIKDKKLKVATYCRVSTNHAAQLSSYKEQFNWYTEYINSNFNWQFAGVFGDIGKSALRIHERNQFKQMIELAKEGKIDLIITKSITRFSRNTLDTFKIIRDLRERNVGIMFENEKINTLDTDNEFYMEVISAFAQEQSRNMSENIKWGYKAKFKRGDILKKYKNFMGYACENDEVVIVPDEADVVRMIFDLYLDGKSLKQIKEYLEENCIKTVTGKEKWHVDTINKMLSNEKYMGDTLFQKTYSEDFLSKKRLKNDGEVESYYIKNSHPAIVDRVLFNKVQVEKKKRARIIKKSDGTIEISKKKYNSKHLLGNLLICGNCDSSYRRRTERGKVVWRCAKRMDEGRDACSNSPTLKEEEIKGKIIQYLKQKQDTDVIYDENVVKDLIEAIRVFSIDEIVIEKKL